MLTIVASLVWSRGCCASSLPETTFTKTVANYASEAVLNYAAAAGADGDAALNAKAATAPDNKKLKVKEEVAQSTNEAAPSLALSPDYPPPKFVIPVHHVLWRQNDQLVASEVAFQIISNTSSMTKKAIVERDINFVEEVSGKPGEGYFINLGIGTPPQNLNVLIDTGSSNFAVAGQSQSEVDVFFDRERSSTVRDLSTRVKLKYTQGEWRGDLVSDLVSLDPLSSQTRTRVPFSIITYSSKFFLKNAKWQGILGLAYPSLSRPDKNQPNFVDLIVEENQLSNVFGLQLCGSRKYDVNEAIPSAGHLAVGGVSSSTYQGDMYYSPIVRELYYEVVIAEIDVGGTPLSVPCGVFNNQRTIVDSGTTNLLLPHSAYNALISALKRWTSSGFWSRIPPAFWQRTQLICVHSGEIDFATFPVIGVSLFSDENQAFRLKVRPEQYLRAVSAYGSGGNCYKLSIAPSGKNGDNSGSILGAILMEGFYVVFDKSRKRIGWAQNKCDAKSLDAITSTLTAPRQMAVNVTHCKAPTQFSFIDSFDTNKLLMIGSYVLGGVAVFLLAIIVFLLMEPLCRRKKVVDEGPRERNQRDYEQIH